VIRVLGPIQVVTPDGDAIDLPSATQRRLLAVLAVHAPTPVRSERLAALLQVSPSGLRTCVSRLRKVLDDDDLVSRPGCYELTATIDAHHFCHAVAASAAQPGLAVPGERLRGLERALASWLGPPYDEFAGEDWASGEATRLTELHAAATEDYADELIVARRRADAIAVLSEHIARHPLRDRARGLLLRALAGAGRQTEALRAYQDYRTMLAESVGTEPSEDVRQIERRVASGWDGCDQQPPPGTGSVAPLTVDGASVPDRMLGDLPRADGVHEVPPALAIARTGPFVGRDDVLTDLVDGWRSGRWHALLVAGEPGIGKTRLLAELAHAMHGQGGEVAVGRCDEDFVVSYRPWTELLEPLVRSPRAADEAALGATHLDQLHRILPSLPPRHGSVPVPATGDAAAQRALLVDAVVALLRVVSPVVLVLDDIHWIDEPSLQVLHRVLAAAVPGVTVLGAFRDTDVDRDGPLAAVIADLRGVAGVRRLTVDGIDDVAVAQLVERWASRGLDTDGHALARAICERTAGNPLFVRELILDLADREGIGSGTDASERLGTLDLPEGLVELIDRRVARLGGDALGVLRTAAAVGHRFDVGVVEEAVAIDRATREVTPPTIDVLGLLELACAAGVVVDDGDAMVFRHAVIRGALLGQLSTVRRRRLHRDVALALERVWSASLGRHLEELAHHHDAARTPDAPRWYRRAAEAAAASLDSGAVALADRGLELLAATDDPDPVLRCDLLIARAVGLRLAGTETIDDARRAAEAAVALGDQERIASALLSLSVRSSDRDVAEHIAFLTEGLAHVTDLAPVSRWHVAAELAIRKSMAPTIADAAEDRRGLLDVVGHLDPADPSACQLAMRCARNLTSTSFPRDAAAVAERFAAGSQGVDSDGLPIELGLSTMWLHLGDRARSDRYLEVAASHPLRRYWAFDCQVRQRLVMRHLLDGRWADASEEIAAVRARAAHERNVLLGCEAQVNWLRRETGDPDVNLRASSAMATTRPLLRLPQAFLASDAAEAGCADVARAQLDRLAADGYVGAGHQWMAVLALGNLAWAAVAVDARAHATGLRRLLAPYEGQLAVIGTGTHVMCAVDRLLAGLAALEGDHDGADRLFAAALDQEHGVGSSPLQARTQHWWGRALRRRGDRARAAPRLERARSIASELGMAALVRQLDQLDADG
jgi:DNA-binding SARP family transcriptional activator